MYDPSYRSVIYLFKRNNKNIKVQLCRSDYDEEDKKASDPLLRIPVIPSTYAILNRPTKFSSKNTLNLYIKE